jgi:hypothetical protein
LGLSIQLLGPLPGLVNNSMFQRFHAPLSAGLVLICQDGSVKQVSRSARPRWRDYKTGHVYTQVQWPSSFATTIKRRSP